MAFAALLARELAPSCHHPLPWNWNCALSDALGQRIRRRLASGLAHVITPHALGFHPRPRLPRAAAASWPAHPRRPPQARSPRSTHAHTFDPAPPARAAPGPPGPRPPKALRRPPHCRIDTPHAHAPVANMYTASPPASRHRPMLCSIEHSPPQPPTVVVVGRSRHQGTRTPRPGRRAPGRCSALAPDFLRNIWLSLQLACGSSAEVTCTSAVHARVGPVGPPPPFGAGLAAFFGEAVQSYTYTHNRCLRDA